MSRLSSILLAVFILFVFSCTKDTATSSVDCPAITPTYKNDIAVIMSASCATAGCHSAASRSGGIDVSSYAATLKAVSNSRFLPSIKHQSGAQSMPQGAGKLSDPTIAKIECWISNGTPE